MHQTYHGTHNCDEGRKVIYNYTRYFDYYSMTWCYSLTLLDGSIRAIRVASDDYNENEPDYVKCNLSLIEEDILRNLELNKLREAIKEDAKLHPEHPLITKARKEEATRQRETDKSISNNFKYSSHGIDSAVYGFAGAAFLAAGVSGNCSAGTAGC